MQGAETNFACGFRHAGFLAAWALVLYIPPPPTRRLWMHRVLPAMGLWAPLLVQVSLNTSVIR